MNTEETAIQKDAGEQAQEPKAPVSAREERMAEIKERLKAEREADEPIAIINMGEPKADEGDDTPESAPKPKAEKTEKPDAPADYLVERDGKRFLKLKVDGKEEEVELDRLRADAQKLKAADNRLREAAEQQRRNQAQAAQLAELAKRMQSAPKTPQPAPPSSEDDPDADAVVEAIYGGDEAAARKALAQFKSTLRSSSPATTVNEDDVIRKAEESVMRRIEEREYTNALRSAYASFEQQFPDILADPNLSVLVDRETITIQNEDRSLSPEQILHEAGKRIRNWAGGTGATASTKQDRKANSASGVPSLNRAAQTRPPAREPKTRRDVIAEMRASRGLPV